MILAAGMGSRMRPLTNQVPKPLLPFMNQSLIDFSISKIKEAGISQIIVNTHYKSEEMAHYIQAHHPDCIISHEPTLLGTGGAISAIKSWLGSSDLLVYNSDILCASNLIDLIKKHRSNPELFATMLLLQNPHPNKTVLSINSDQELISFGDILPGCTEHSFTGIHILSNQMVHMIPEGFYHIIDTYKQCMARGYKIGTLLYDGFWKDLGTPYDYWQAHRDVKSDPNKMDKFCKEQKLTFHHEHNLPCISSNQSSIDDSAHFVGDVFVLGESSVGENAKIVNSILIDTNVPANHTVENMIMYKHMSIQHTT